MLHIGLTGGIGSGKSTAALYFSELGIPVIDADQIAYEITKPYQKDFKKIIIHFGNQVLTSKGFLNRVQLKKLIFENPIERQWLENLLHPLIIFEMKEELKRINAPYCILVIPLLAEFYQIIDFLDVILVIDASKMLQIQRTKARDQLPNRKVQLILQSQSSSEKRLAIANDIIVNDKTTFILRKAILQLHCKYLRLAKKKFVF